MNLKQCSHCPWRKDVDPHTIPNGYCEAKHAALADTIAEPGGLTAVLNCGPLRMMACHESEPGSERPCVGWMANQLGAGNNIALRLWYSREVRTGRIKGPLKLAGEQHECFEDTLPEGE